MPFETVTCPSSSPVPPGRPRCFVSTMGVVAVLLFASAGNASEVHLKSGIVLEGIPVPVSGLTKSVAQRNRDQWNSYPLMMVETPMKRYFVPQRQIEKDGVRKDELITPIERFKVDQKIVGRNGLTPTSVATFLEVTPFDEFGRRRVRVATKKGPVDIIQGITEISSKHVKVTGLSHQWEFAIATTSVPPETLSDILNRILDENRPEDRMSLVRFYVESGRYFPAAEQLAAIREDFPDLKDRVDELEVGLRNALARRLLLDLRQRRGAGQHELAFQAARMFPRAKMEAGVLKQIDDLLDQHAGTQQKIDSVTLLLGELSTQLETNAREATEALRLEIRNQLSFASIDRMEAFLTLEPDPSLNPSQKLSLAYSGWILGSDYAVTDFDATLRLIEGRYLVLDYLRDTQGGRRGELLALIQNLEGMNTQTLARMVPNLPPIRETTGMPIGDPHRIVVPDAAGEEEVSYHVTLPLEYDPHHRYPLILSLGGPDRTPLQQVRWWAGTAQNPLQAQRRGYIVISPDYLGGEKAYDYAAAKHAVILECLRDARLRFNIDSDRIFLTGHGAGGDAAFDLGLSHSDLFAGVIPICGIADKFSKWYWANGKHTAWYIVGGELDRQSLERNARDVNRMMRYGHDVIYAEYIGRGYESYYEEIHHLFDWMDLHQRTNAPVDFEAKILRPTDTYWFWVQLQGLPRNLNVADVLLPGGRRAIRPLELSVSVKAGTPERPSDRTTIYIRPSTSQVTLWLSPDIIDFDRRVTVKVGSRTLYSDFVRPSVEDLLNDVLRRGDRQTLRWAKLVLN